MQSASLLLVGIFPVSKRKMYSLYTHENVDNCELPLTLFDLVSAALQPEHFSSVGIEVLFTAVLNRRLLYKSDIQPHHLKRSYSVGMFGPVKQSWNLLLINSDGDIIGATQIASDILSPLFLKAGR
jgi:hypothetical protein